MYPELIVSLGKIVENVRTVVGMCHEHGIRVTGITKDFNGDPHIVEAFIEGGVDALGDSRLRNIERYPQTHLPKWLIRSPQISRAEQTVTQVDLSLNSEPAVLEALDRACEATGTSHHDVILMYDLGDLREGFVSREELMEAAELAASLPHLRLRGVGANLTCLSFVQPDEEKFAELADAQAEMERRFDVSDPLVSGGNSAAINLMLDGGVPSKVNDFRLGESLLFGRERARYRYLPETHNDAFILNAEIIELKRKPSLPWGTIGADSYGNVPSFPDKGERLRAVLAMGHQDCDPETMWPLDPEVHIIGASCDHLIIDMTDCSQAPQVGDIVSFRCGYHATLKLFNSDYVEKVFK